jgi:hypothetical protein
MVEYVGDYRSIGYAGQRIITKIVEWFKLVEAEPGSKGVCSEIEQTDNSITVNFLGFRIIIRLDICASEDVGFIKWFYPEQQPDGKTVMLLIIKDKFDKENGIKGNDISKTGYDISNISVYSYDTLGMYLEKVDKRISEERVI